jgi:hypothetical protein
MGWTALSWLVSADLLLLAVAHRVASRHERGAAEDAAGRPRPPRHALAPDDQLKTLTLCIVFGALTSFLVATAARLRWVVFADDDPRGDGDHDALGGGGGRRAEIACEGLVILRRRIDLSDDASVANLVHVTASFVFAMIVVLDSLLMTMIQRQGKHNVLAAHAVNGIACVSYALQARVRSVASSVGARGGFLLLCPVNTSATLRLTS